MTKKRIQILYSVLVLFLIVGTCFPVAAQERKLSHNEKSADHNFIINQNFGKAMKQYEKAIKKEKNALNKAALNLKVARLYFMLSDYANAAAHFAQANSLERDLFSVDDICDFADSYRFLGDHKKAEGVFLDREYDESFNHSQRFQNMLNGIIMDTHTAADPHMLVARLAMNTNKSEFWVGKYGTHPFYATSDSKLNDPFKIFFHHVRFFDLIKTDSIERNKPHGFSDWFSRVPVDLQVGPVVFSADTTTMIATEINYKKSNQRSMELINRDTRPFCTRLVVSHLNKNQTSFSKFEPLFDQDDDASYADPFLLNDGKTLLFCSDMPGGYGGFDLYYTVYDEQSKKWSYPVNLGPQVNTEGNEIFPVVYNGQLVFSSNGLPGCGGYDIYNVAFQKNNVVEGYVSHYPMPVNSSHNDYGFLPVSSTKGYFVSDRAGQKEDIYSLDILNDNQVLGGASSPLMYGMKQDDAMAGGDMLLSGIPQATESQYVPLFSDSQALPTPDAVSLSNQNPTDQTNTGANTNTDDANRNALASDQANNTSEDANRANNDSLNHDSDNQNLDSKNLTSSSSANNGMMGDPRGDLLMSLYFGFDSANLTKMSVSELVKFVNKVNDNKFRTMTIEGFTDQIGNPKYNLILSKRRAQSVVNFLKRKGFDPSFTISPKGVAKADTNKLNNGLFQFRTSDGKIDAKKVNSTLRRVDIYGSK